MRVLKWSRNFKKLEYDNRVGEGGESTMAPTLVEGEDVKI